MRRVLGVQPRLHRVPGGAQRGLVEREPLARRDPQLLLDEVDAVDELRDRVLDLQPRVHLEEEVLGPGGEELDRAGALVAARPRERHGGRAERRAARVVHHRRGRLLDHLLVAALERALALAEVEHLPVAVGEHLHLDVARALEVALDEHAAVAERGRRLAPGGVERRAELRARRAPPACPSRRRRRAP